VLSFAHISVTNAFEKFLIFIENLTDFVKIPGTKKVIFTENPQKLKITKKKETITILSPTGWM
jgi:hypothetical protein